MAWVEKLTTGYRGCWRDPDGKKCYTNATSHPEHPYALKRDARAAAVEAEAKASRKAAAGNGTLAARTLWGDWWDIIAAGRATPDTMTDVNEASVVRNYLRPRWGDTELIGVKHRLVQGWVDSLVDGTAKEWTGKRPPEASYVQRIFAVFRASMQQAVAAEVLDATPCAGIKLPTIRRKRKTTLTTDEAETIGAQLRADYRDALNTILDSGARPGELCGLHADRVDLDSLWVDIDMVFVAGKNVIRSWPKDKDARRVPITRNAADIIRRRLADRDLTAGCGVQHADGRECGSVLVFLTEHGKPMNPIGLRNRLRHAAKTHQVPHRSPYTARRGFATRLARGGADPFAIAEAMGHASVDQSQDYIDNERIGPVIRAALGDREPLKVVSPAPEPDEAAPDPEAASG